MQRMYNTHLKNGTISNDGGWHFGPLDEGWTNYAQVLGMLRDAGYGRCGASSDYMTIECLGPDARERPVQTARRDLSILRRYLATLPWEV